MWFLKFWLISSVVSLSVIILMMIGILSKVSRKYNIPKINKADKPKISLLESIPSLLQIIIACSIPFFNIVTTIYYVFKGEEIIMASIDKAYAKEEQDKSKEQ